MLLTREEYNEFIKSVMAVFEKIAREGEQGKLPFIHLETSEEGDRVQAPEED